MDQSRQTRTLEDLSVIIPAFNEQEGILETLQELRSFLPAVQIVVVDDGSTDTTGRIVETVDGVTLISHQRNRGYGAALKTGIRATQRACIAWYDADGQHRPQDLLDVATPVLEEEKDIVIGVRGADSDKQADRVVGKAILRWVAQFLTRQRIPDLNSGLRCFRRSVLLRYLHLLPEGFSASTTSTILALKRGYRVGYVPITTNPRVGTSTVRILSDGLATVNLIFRLIVLFEALRVFCVLGIALMIPGLIYGFSIALIRGQGFPTLAGTIVIAGILTIFLGVVADQVTELRKERFENYR